jgi:leader peptidase (prepilin peptidase)/N-methyltransferase
MTYAGLLATKLIIAAIAALLFGNGCVVMFNRMPLKWFMYSEGDEKEPHESLPEELKREYWHLQNNSEDDPVRQRLSSSPWKYVFVAYFGAAGVYLALTSSIQYEVGTLFVLAIVLEMAIADSKYRIVPDQLSILLAVTGLGFAPLHDEWTDFLAGAATGLFLGLAVFGAGMLIYRKAAIGGADIKFFACMGLIAGSKGILAIFVITALLAAVHAVIRVVSGQTGLKDEMPLLPYAFVAVTVYMLFLWDMLEVITL